MVPSVQISPTCNFFFIGNFSQTKKIHDTGVFSLLRIIFNQIVIRTTSVWYSFYLQRRLVNYNLVMLFVTQKLHFKNKPKCPSVYLTGKIKIKKLPACIYYLTLKAPRKSASENVVCLRRQLHLLANFSNLNFAYRQTVWTQIRLLLKEQSDLDPHCLQQWLLK